MLLIFTVLALGEAWATWNAEAAKCYVLNSDPDVIIRSCTFAIDSGQLAEQQVANALNNRGDAYARKEDYDRAIQDFNQAIRLVPNYVRAYYNRGNVHQRKGDFDSAIADYGQAIRLDPKFGDAFNNRGAAYQHMGDNDRAIAAYSQAIRLNPNYATAFYNRGNAHRQNGDYVQAIQDFDQAIRLNPNYATAFYNRGIALFYQGEFAAAKPDLSKAVQLRPSDLYYILWLYLAQARSGSDNARADLASAAAGLNLEKWPGPIVSMHLGRVTSKAALEAASDSGAKGQREKHCEAYFHFGQYLLMQEHSNEAMEMFRAAIATGALNSYEYDGAKAELRRLGN